MIVTKKEIKEIIGICLKERDGELGSADSAPLAEEERDEQNVPSESAKVDEAEDIKALINECLDSRLQPITEQLGKINEIQEAARDSCERLRKLSNLYDEMIAYKNRSTLILTRYTEMYERIRNFKLFCGENFVVDEETPKEIRSVVQRVNNLETTFLKNLNSFGVVPIWPVRNDEFHDDEHQAIAETPVQTDDDRVGAIAECLKMGLRKDGVVTKAAEVVLFKAAVPLSDPEQISEQTVTENQQGEN